MDSTNTFVSANGKNLSYSRLYTANACRKKYEYKYLRQIYPLPGQVYLDDFIRRYRGVLIHAGIEYGFLGKDPEVGVNDSAGGIRAEGVTDDQRAALDEMVPGCVQVAKDLLDWLPVTDWEPYVLNGTPMVEAELLAPLPGWKGFVGYADLVARHRPTGRVLVLDWKTRERFEADGVDMYNRQFAFYQHVLSLPSYGVPCVGSLLVEMKPEPPKRAPRIVREDGGGIDSVRVSSDGRFRSIPTFRSQTYIKNIWQQFEKEAAQLAALTPADCTPNLSGFNCGKCEYQRLCQAQLQGDDVAYVLQTKYKGPHQPDLVVDI